MSNRRTIADQICEDDVAYLANAYDLDQATVRGFNDADWCDFLGCGMYELPYYLFDENSPAFVEDFDGDARADINDDFAFDQDSLFSIDHFIEEEIMRQPVPTTKPKSKALATTTNEYSRPSAFAHTGKSVSSVPHYFELVK